MASRRRGRIENYQVDFIRAQNVDHFSQDIQFHSAAPTVSARHTAISTSLKGPALAPGKSAEEIGENDLGMGPEVLRGQRQTLLDVLRQLLETDHGGNGEPSAYSALNPKVPKIAKSDSFQRKMCSNSSSNRLAQTLI